MILFSWQPTCLIFQYQFVWDVTLHACNKLKGLLIFLSQFFILLKVYWFEIILFMSLSLTRQQLEAPKNSAKPWQRSCGSCNFGALQSLEYCFPMGIPCHLDIINYLNHLSLPALFSVLVRDYLILFTWIFACNPVLGTKEKEIWKRSCRLWLVVLKLQNRSIYNLQSTVIQCIIIEHNRGDKTTLKPEPYPPSRTRQAGLQMIKHSLISQISGLKYLQLLIRLGLRLINTIRSCRVF